MSFSFKEFLFFYCDFSDRHDTAPTFLISFLDCYFYFLFPHLSFVSSFVIKAVVERIAKSLRY